MWTVTYNGVELDIDPLNLDMRTFAEMEQRAGFSGYAEFMGRLSNWDPQIWGVLYWAATRRKGIDPGPFGDYEGPTFRDVFAQRERLEESLDEVALFMGKGKAAPKAQAETSGSPTSEPSTDGADPTSSTD